MADAIDRMVIDQRNQSISHLLLNSTLPPNRLQRLSEISSFWAMFEAMSKVSATESDPKNTVCSDPKRALHPIYFLRDLGIL